MKRIILGTTLLLCSLTVSVLATVPGGTLDDVVFSGRVVDDDRGQPLANVQVYLEGSPFGSTTNPLGAYSILVPRENLTGLAGRLIAQAVGYQEAIEVVAFSQDSVETVFRLRPNEPERQEAVVLERGRATAEVRAAADQSFAAPPMTAMSAVGNAGRGVAGGMAGGGWNRESYAHITENGFLSSSQNPLSTFSIDVDRASYSNVRRFLLDRQLPPIDAVRIEEMVNYFTYSYPTPRGEHPFAVATEVGDAPWHQGHKLLRVSLASAPLETSRMPANNLVFLLDVSGSMNSPDKLPLVKQAMRVLVNELRPRDRVAIVVYAGAAGLVLPSTSGEDRGRILHSIEALEAGGSTAGGAGLRLAYRVARENFLEHGNNRVILATDGDFNVGESSDSEMIRMIEDMRRQGTFLTVLGFGTGNLQDSKMEQIADHGNGNYAYIDSLLEARKVLVTEMGGTLLTVAKDVKFQVEFNPATVASYRLIGYENRLLAAEDFNDDWKDAGEMGAGHTVTALYEIVPVGVESGTRVGSLDPLRYQQTPSRPTVSPARELAHVRVRYKPPTDDRSLLLEQPVHATTATNSSDLRFAAAVAGFGMLLRESEHRGSLTADDVIALASSALDDDDEGYREEFVRLVRIYQSISGSER